MRQLRIACGDNTKATVAVLNEVILELYPQVLDRDAARRAHRGESMPRLVSPGYVLRLERGFHSSQKMPEWLRAAGPDDESGGRGSRVPAWLVRAYDVAFGADGYLIDMYRWAQALIEDHRHNPPRRTSLQALEIVPGQELAYLCAGFGEPPEFIREALGDCADQMARHRRAQSTEPPWAPLPGDGSGSFGEFDENNPEAMLIAPGGYHVARWILQNNGSIPWRDRYIYRVGGGSHTIVTPRVLALADTDPGGSVEFQVPLRAPTRPGTYRLCVKSGWPDGTYCFPATLLGQILTVIVPPTDLAGWELPWPVL